jgi:hypothetical protein
MTEAEEMEELVWKRRSTKFIQDGCIPDEAYELAGLMMLRDRDPQDDRRVCFECTGYKNKYCEYIKDKVGRPTQQLRFILQRCDYFDLRGKK